MAEVKKGEEIKIAGHPLSHFEGMTDEEILGIKGIGPKTLEEIRAAQAEAVEPEAAELTAAEVGDAAEAAELAERNLGAEPKAVEVACETCGEPFTPAKPEHKHCPKCFRAYRKRGAQEQAERALKQVHGILSGIIERNTWYGYTEPMDLFEKAKAKYAAGDYRNLVGDLYQGVLGKANEITARGDVDFIARLIDSGELEETPELQRLVVGADSFLADEKFREAAAKAQEAKQLAGRLRREQGEAKKQELLASLVFEPQSQRKREGRGSKKGAR